MVARYAAHGTLLPHTAHLRLRATEVAHHNAIELCKIRGLAYRTDGLHACLASSVPHWPSSTGDEPATAVQLLADH